jgi:hypothetical protein
MPTKNDFLTTTPELERAVLDALAKAAKGRDDEYAFLTAYQILAALESGQATALIDKYGPAGGGGGTRPGAGGRLAMVAVILEKHHQVEIMFLDTRGMRIEVPVRGEVEPAGPTLGLYRLKKK